MRPTFHMFGLGHWLFLVAYGQCPGVIGKNPSVSKSHRLTWCHLSVCSLFNRVIFIQSSKMNNDFHEVLNFNRLFFKLRGWSHRPFLKPYVSISSYNSVKSGRPTCISQHNPQQFHRWNQIEKWVWSGHELVPRGLHCILCLRITCVHDPS